MFRFIARWYPLLVVILILPIGTTAGGIAGHNDPSLGHTVVPYLYPPWRFFDWLSAGGTNREVPPLQHAGITSMWTMIILFFATFIAMLIERTRGRDFGWFINALFFLIMLQHDISNTANAYNSNTDFLGSGGIADRSKPRNSPRSKRKR